MARNIYCSACNKDRRLDPVDVVQGWKTRAFYIVCKNPYQVPLQCDDCGNEIEDGSFALAVTSWRGESEWWPVPDWEKQFGDVVPAESVQLAKALIGETVPNSPHNPLPKT